MYEKQHTTNIQTGERVLKFSDAEKQAALADVARART
jgi:hypothetical protein